VVHQQAGVPSYNIAFQHPQMNQNTTVLLNVVKHCIWYLNMLKELKHSIKYIEINIDKKDAIYNAKNQSINPKIKHMDIRVHYIRELIKNNKIKLKYNKSRI